MNIIFYELILASATEECNVYCRIVLFMYLFMGLLTKSDFFAGYLRWAISQCQ